MVYENPQVESSYRENDIGRTLYELVLDLRPKKIIEFGTLNGYSTIAMAMALEELGEGKIYAYDLWNKYPHKHTSLSETYYNIAAYGLEDFVELLSGDFYEWNPEDFDMMHIDISNTGETIKHAKKLRKFGGEIVFEGGSKERDAVKWMKKYKKLPINDSGVKFEVLNESFPSISIIR